MMTPTQGRCQSSLQPNTSSEGDVFHQWLLVRPQFGQKAAMQTAHRRQITRNRELLACTECRRRKLRCDRSTPCGSCARRGDEASCTYQRFARGSAGEAGNERERRIEAESRLEHLEQLVQQLASQSSSAPQASSSQRLQMQDDGGGNVEDAQEEVAYSGPTHWSAMLEDIEELRFAIAPGDTDYDVSCGTRGDDGTSILFGARDSMQFEEVLAEFLPSRQDSDRLVAAYFRATSILAPFIHSSHFRRRYKQFWESPSNAPPLWTSIFFSICHVATNGLSAPQGIFDTKYALAAAHCLAIGKYYIPQHFATEAFLLFIQSKLITENEINSEVGVLLGTLIRVASRMGYHRDPDHFNMSPFTREMRRRTWSLCAQLDLLVSFSLGLPSNIQFPTWDTKAPGNLRDSDFDEDCLEIPPSRPDSEMTEISFYIGKHRLMQVFEKIIRHSLSTTTKPEATVETLDSELQHQYKTMPEWLQPRPMTDSVVDSAHVIVTRLCVYFLYLKCRCVLHREKAAQGQLENIQICYEAGSTLVQYFLDMHKELQPGGQLDTERWFDSAIPWSDFKIGVMSLCLVLCVTQPGIVGSQIDRTLVVAHLRRSQTWLSERAFQSPEMSRVGKLVGTTILRFGTESSDVEPVATTNGHFDPSLPQTSASAPSAGLATFDPATIPGTTTADWTGWGQGVQAPVDDVTWSYLEQFLNLSNYDPMMEM